VERLATVVAELHADLAVITGIDRADALRDDDALAAVTGAAADLALIALRGLDAETSRHDDDVAGQHDHGGRHRGAEVEPGIARMGVRGQSLECGLV